MLKLWILIAVGAFIIEIFTFGNLICIWFTIGAIAAIPLALLDCAAIWQYIVFFAISIVSMVLIRPLATDYLRGNVVATNSDRLIGSTTVLTKSISATSWGEANINGIIWSCASSDNLPIDKSSVVKIIAIDGAKLIVKKMD
ncbi:MAG: NfeD family protein [Erysipelotrichia bacterium]|nr:NfeD family protein [Erysipelotrichia bacterium]